MSKKKKEKIIYYDDNSTIGDMSNVGRRRIPTTSEQKGGRPPSTFRDKWATYWQAVKMMFFPMLAVLAALSIIFLIMFLLSG